MKGKLLFVAGAAVGYVLGARAGRRRYEQIAAAASKVWNTPPVQKGVRQAQDFALDRVSELPSALLDGTKKAFAQVLTGRSDETSATAKTPTKRGAAKPAAASDTDSASTGETSDN